MYKSCYRNDLSVRIVPEWNVELKQRPDMSDGDIISILILNLLIFILKVFFKSHKFQNLVLKVVIYGFSI